MFPFFSTSKQVLKVRITNWRIITPIFPTMSYLKMAFLRLIYTKDSAIAKFVRAAFFLWFSVVRMPSTSFAFIPVFLVQPLAAIGTFSVLPIPSSISYFGRKRHYYILPRPPDGWFEVEVDSFWVLYRNDCWTGITVAMIPPPWKPKPCFHIRYYPQDKSSHDYDICSKPTLEEAKLFAEEYYSRLPLSTTNE